MTAKIQLETRAEEYYLKYRTFNKTLIDLYTQNPLDNKLLSSMRAKSICGKLLDLSNLISPRIVTIVNPLYKHQNKLKKNK